MYESNGILPVINSNGNFIDTNGMEVANLNAPNVVYQNMVGDPEWIGVLEFPDRPHSPTNRFIGRYAYVVVPAGKTLDLNYIHNWATRPNGNNGVVNLDGFHRNHGIGSWELNLAGFFRDLNTNIWPQASYVYNPVTTFPNSGTAFIDAVDFLHFRYAQNLKHLYNMVFVRLYYERLFQCGLFF